MKLTSDEINNFCESCNKILEENKKFKNGWIQSFFEIDGATCKICGEQKMVIFPYPSLNKQFRYVYVYGCCSCGASYVDEHLDLDEYYKDAYAKQNRKDRDIDPKEYFDPNRSPALSRYFNRAARHWDIINKTYNKRIANILDFGSGPGYFLYLCNAKNKFSVEPDLNCKKYLEYIGVKNIDIKSTNIHFDVIYSSHSIEHLHIDNLKSTLDCFLSRLSDDGLLFMEVPCGNLLRYSVYARHDPHTIFFTPQSINIALLNSGFKSIYIFPVSRKTKAQRSDCKYSPKGEYLERLDFLSAMCCVASKVPNDSRLKHE